MIAPGAAWWAGRRWWELLVVATTVALGCARSPSPLTPNLRGSIGVPGRGVLSGGCELPRFGVGFVRYRPRAKTHFGLPRLVDSVMQAAASVERLRPGGAPLVVGDLSAVQGGRIHRHRTHRNGRDVDLLWYVQTPAGEPVQSPGFVHLGPDGLGAMTRAGRREYVRLDVDREWILIKALLLMPRANIQWLFISKPIEALITEHAWALGEPLDLLWHAETVMRQPTDSTSHDDHLHVRIACTPEEVVEGCEGGGPYWPWLPAYPEWAPESDEALVAALIAPIEHGPEVETVDVQHDTPTPDPSE